MSTMHFSEEIKSVAKGSIFKQYTLQASMLLYKGHSQSCDFCVEDGYQN